MLIFYWQKFSRSILRGKTIITATQAISYDYLVIATGSEPSYLNVSGAPEHTFPLRTLKHAVTLRNHIVSCFEEAVISNNDERRRQLMTFVIVGGGATGVEMAGALQELIHDSFSKDYPQLDLKQAKVILLQSGSSLLKTYPQRLQKHAIRQLRDRGVKLHFNCRVRAATQQEVTLEDGSSIATATIIWTAGLTANVPQSQTELATVGKNKLEVLSSLQLPNYPQVYGAGDLTYIEHNGKPLIGVAPEALQQGDTIANNIKRQLNGKSPQPFNYFNKGRAAIIARNSGVAYLLGKIPVGGFLAWALWLSIHLYYLPGMSNRLKVLGAWLRDYVLRDRNVKQILAVKKTRRFP